MTEKTLLFEGRIYSEFPSPVNGNSYICPVCMVRIVGEGLHIIGSVVNPAVHEKALAKFRYSIDHDFPFPGDEKVLKQKNIPSIIEIDFFCHDYQCFAIFLRNKFVVRPSILSYDIMKEEGVEKYQKI